MSTLVETQPERTSSVFDETTTWAYHLPAGPVDDAVTWRPVLCGGGIALPGHPEFVTEAEVCPDCTREAAAQQPAAAVPVP